MMKLSPRWIGPALAVAFLVACSDDESPPPGASPMDAGFPDLGQEEPDSGVFPDAGPAPDATPCDPITGGGCVGGTTCAYVPSIDGPQCRDIGAANPIGDPCSPQLTDCEPGAWCVNVPPEPRCRKACRPGQSDCASLPASHVCATLQNASGEFGFCDPVTTCDPVMDACPAGEVCSIVGSDQVGCRPAGTVPVGGSCAQAACARGGVCINLNNSGSICYEACNPDNPMCAGGNAACSDPLTGFSFGVCLGPICDPVNDMCPSGQRCTIVSTGVAACRPAGNVPRGRSCAMASCQRGNVCVMALGDLGPECYQPCRGATTCDNGVCSNNLNGFDFGICR